MEPFEIMDLRKLRAVERSMWKHGIDVEHEIIHGWCTCASWRVHLWKIIWDRWSRRGKRNSVITEVDRIVLSGVKLVLQQIESVSQPSG
jgi:hypothetical protein